MFWVPAGIAAVVLGLRVGLTVWDYRFTIYDDNLIVTLLQYRNRRSRQS